MRKNFIRNIKNNINHAKEKNKKIKKNHSKPSILIEEKKLHDVKCHLINDNNLYIISQRHKKNNIVKYGQKFNLNNLPSFDDIESIKNQILDNFK